MLINLTNQSVYLFDNYARRITHYMYFSDDQMSYSPRYVLTVSMGMLSIAHIHRQITDYGGYTLDFTGYDNM